MDNITTLVVKGKEVFWAELEAAMKVPEKERYVVVGHHLTEHGEGEPIDPEEMIVEDK